jgi:hypothetical protein
MSQLAQLASQIEATIQLYTDNLRKVESGGYPEECSYFTIKKGKKDLYKDSVGYEIMIFMKAIEGSADPWEQYFEKVIESLLGLSTSTSDDIERQTCLCRIYVWFIKMIKEHKIFLSNIKIDIIEMPMTRSYGRPGFRNLSELPAHYQLQPNNESLLPLILNQNSPEKLKYRDREIKDEYEHIVTDDDVTERELQKLWLQNRRELLQEDEARAQLSVRMKNFEDNRVTARARPQSASSVPIAPLEGRFDESIQRPLSAMRQLAQRIVAKDSAPSEMVGRNPHRLLQRYDVYMYLSDSDDDIEAPLNPALRHLDPGATSAFGKTLLRKERPKSAQHLKKLAEGDPEVKVIPTILKHIIVFMFISVREKVLLRYSNYRRAPLTMAHLKWIEDIEKLKRQVNDERVKVETDAAKLKAKAKPSGDAAKDKSKDKAKKPVAKKSKNDGKMSALSQLENRLETLRFSPPVEAAGPMRQQAVDECERIKEAFRKHLHEDEAEVTRLGDKIMRTLVKPQDRPDCVMSVMERNPLEGLRRNPNPPEFWRKFGGGQTKKKGKGKGKA